MWLRHSLGEDEPWKRLALQRAVALGAENSENEVSHARWDLHKRPRRQWRPKLKADVRRLLNLLPADAASAYHLSDDGASSDSPLGWARGRSSAAAAVAVDSAAEESSDVEFSESDDGESDFLFSDAEE